MHILNTQTDHKYYQKSVVSSTISEFLVAFQSFSTFLSLMIIWNLQAEHKQMPITWAASREFSKFKTFRKDAKERMMGFWMEILRSHLK